MINLRDAKDFLGHDLRVGDWVIYAGIGSGSNHGGFLRKGIIETIEDDSWGARCTLTIGNSDTGRTCSRGDSCVVKMPKGRS